MNYATCPDDGTHLKARPRPSEPGARLTMTCPTCGKNFRIGETGVLEIPAQGDEG